MKVSLRWLSDYVDITLDPPALAHRLTMAGTEAEGISRTGAAWEGIRIAEIGRLEKHPNADRLLLATVNLGDRTETVVTGAPNLEAGARVPYAPVGTKVINGHTGQPMKIEPVRLRGILSAGMVLSEKELGLSGEHAGILILPADAPVGAPLADYLGDTVLDLAVTPNRPDCLSMLGIAREVAVLTGQKVRRPSLEYPSAGAPAAEEVSIEIADPDLCRRYSATLIRGVTVGPSPRWLQKRLESAGMRPINNVVDVTNYVMLEFGQPLHAFDFEHIHGRKIVVRRARPGETIETLDAVRRELEPETLMIADAERAVAIAGVMGGADSEVSAGTTTILLESANFDNISIRRTSARLRLRSEASARFDKGITPELTEPGVRRATQLIAALAGGKAAPGIVDVYPGRHAREPLLLPLSEVRRLLGIAPPVDQMLAVFRALEFDAVPVVSSDTGLAWEVGRPESEANALLLTPPADRVDVNLIEDLVEEIARIVGYDELPTTMIGGQVPAEMADPERELAESIRDLLVAVGFQEVVTYSLVSWNALEQVCGREELGRIGPIRLANPMSSEQEYLRPTLRASVLTAVASNARHWHDGIRLFEVGRIYVPRDGDLPDERRVATGVLAGRRWPRSWAVPIAAADYYDAKGVIETLLGRLGLDPTFVPAEDPNLHPGKAVGVEVEGRRVGTLGELHPQLTEGLEIAAVAPVTLFDLDLRELLAAGPRQHRYRPIPRYPPVERALAVVVDLPVAAESVRAIVTREPLVRQVVLFDVYTGQPLPEGKKSLAYSVSYQSPERTLTDPEVDAVQARIVDQLRADLGAELRT